MIDLVTMAAVLQKHENFWLKHDTSGIPDHLLGMMLLLSDSMILESSQADVFQVYRRGVAFFEDANVKVFKAVTTTVGIPEAATFLNKFAADQIPVHLVLAEDMLRDSDAHANLVQVQRTLSKRCKLSVLRHDPKLTIVVTDSVMVLVLPRTGEIIDISNALVGQSREAITWGTALFNHYAKAAKRVSLAEFT